MALLEAQRRTLGDEAVDAALAPIKARLATLCEEPAEQRKLVTVLFADVTGFTSLSQSMDPEEVAAAMNSLWRRVDGALTDHGGTIDKHIGDAVMALFGAPVAREDDAERAVRAALAMQEVVSDVAREVVGDDARASLRMRIGLHTGPVHLGKVGSGQEYTAIGDTVNVASRLEEAAPPGGVFISHDTFRHVRGRFEVSEKGPLPIRGRSEAMRVYEVTGIETSDTASSMMVGGVEIPFVGRERELAHLFEAAGSVASGDGPLAVTVVAEAGLGASRLAATFSDRLRGGKPVPEILEARGGVAAPPEILEARGGGGFAGRTPYRVLRSILADKFGLSERGGDPAVVEKLFEGLAPVLGDTAKESAHLLGHLAGFQFGESPYLQGILDDPGQVRRRALQAVFRLFTALAVGKPYVVLLLEDLHLLDDGSLDLIEEILESAGRLRLLVVCTARPKLFERRANWTRGDHRVRIDLGRLDDESSRRLLEALLAPARDVPSSLSSRLIETAEGHPLYMEELVRRLIEQGVIDTSRPEWEVRTDLLGEFEVPPTLTALVQARLDALSVNERLVLQRAAVLGRVFWDEALRVLDISEEGARSAVDVDAGIEGLLRRELIVERGEPVFQGTREFAFSQSLVHDVAYEMILLRLRPAFHRRAAVFLSERVGESASAWAWRIAEHWEAAGDGLEAGGWLLKAAEQARRTNAVAEAEEAYRRSLEHLETVGADPGLRLAAMEGLAEVYLRLVRLTEAEEVCRRMRLVEADSGDRIAESKAWAKLARVYQGRSETKEALDATGRAISLARAEDCTGTLATALRERALCLHRGGRYDEAKGPLGEALEIAVRENLVFERARALRLLGLVHARLGDFDLAERHGSEALTLFRTLDHKTLLTASLTSLGELARVRGDAASAFAYYEEALSIARDFGLAGHELVALANMGSALVAMDRASEAQTNLEEVLERAPAKWYGLPETWRFLAEARLSSGDTAGALEAGLKALELAEATESAEMVGAAWRVLGELAAETRNAVTVGGKKLDAPECLKRSVEILDGAGVGPEAARALRSWSRYCLAQGDREHGEKLWAEAQSRFEAMGMPLEVERMNRRS